MQIFLDGVGNETLGIVLDNKPSIPTTQRSVTTTTVPGSTHGNLTQFQGWQDVVVKCSFTVMPDTLMGGSIFQGYNDLLRRLNGWVMDSQRLVFSDDQEFYRLVKQVSVDDASPGSIEVVGNVTVNFTLDPFWYKESDPVELTTTGTLFNPGTQPAEPLITVYGEGVVKFSINNRELTLIKVKDFLTIDSWEKTVIHGEDPGMFDEQLDGEYPLLIPGENKVSLGTATKIVIDGRWPWR